MKLFDKSGCFVQRACSLVGAGAGLGWLVLVFCERKTLLAGWFGLAETNKRTGCLVQLVMALLIESSIALLRSKD